MYDEVIFNDYLHLLWKICFLGIALSQLQSVDIPFSVVFQAWWAFEGEKGPACPSASGSAGSPAQSARQKSSARPCELVHSSAFSSFSSPSLEKTQPSPAQKQDQDKYTAPPASVTPQVNG